MKKRKHDLITKETLHKIQVAVHRKEQVEQGFFDGRFRTRAVKSSKVYNRKKRKFQDRNSE
jgi:hypothetical protein